MTTLAAINALDWSTVEPHYAALENEALTPTSLPNWLRRWSDLERALREAFAHANRAKCEDTMDQKAEATFLHMIQNIRPKAEVAAQALKNKLLAVEGYTPDSEHEQMFKRLRSEAALFREANVPLQAEISTLANDYDKTIGVMSVTLDGVEMTMQQVRQRIQSPERTTREFAWRAEQTRWLQDRDKLDAHYLKLAAMRRQLARNAGLSDYRAYMWQALKRFDYTPQDSLSFHEAIEAEIVPLANKLFEARRLKLGLSSLRPWDLDVDADSETPLQPFADVAELEAGTARIFDRIDPELGAEFAQMRAGFLDLGSRKGKAPGGFCSFFPKTGMPYIFMNAVGTQSDVRTLLHEGGHGFHGMASNAHQDLIWNLGAPMEFSEVASMAMELLAFPYFEKSQGGFYSADEAARARTEQLAKIVTFLPYMAVVDAFQHWVYAGAPEDIQASDLDAKWDELWGRFMGREDWSGLEAERVSGWHRKQHIFQVPFYYVEYGLAQLGALQVWRNALSDQAAAVRSYRSALALGNTRPLPELYQTAGAKLAFDHQTVGELASLVASHLGI